MTFGERAPGREYRIRPAAYLITRNSDGQVATVDTSRGLFLPGGGIEAGEEPEAALKREVLEELGSDLEIDRELGKAIQYFAIREDHIALHATFFSGKVTSREEAPREYEVLWVDPGTAAQGFYHAAHAWAASSLPG